MGDNVIDIRKTVQSENFANKAAMLGLDTAKQVELLNRMYEGKLRFCITNDGVNDCSILLDWVNPNVRILELPEVDGLGIGYLSGGLICTSRNNVMTLKLSKRMKKFNWWDLSEFPNIKGLWLWDTTEIIKSVNSLFRPDYVFLQHAGGSKTERL